MPKKNRIKEWISVDTRISLFQTAMNNSGRNFQSKKVPVKKMAEYALGFYKFAIREIERMGEANIQDLKKIFKDKKKKIKKIHKKKTVTNLINKLAKKKGKK